MGNFSRDFLTNECIENLKNVVVGFLAHVAPSIFFSRILRSEASVYNLYFFRTAVLRKLFDIRFSYKHCNFSRVCLLVEIASKSVTRSITRRAFQFSFHLDWQIYDAILNRPIIARTQILVYRWEPRTRISALFCRRTQPEFSFFCGAG